MNHEKDSILKVTGEYEICSTDDPNIFKRFYVASDEIHIDHYLNKKIELENKIAEIQSGITSYTPEMIQAMYQIPGIDTEKLQQDINDVIEKNNRLEAELKTKMEALAELNIELAKYI